MPHTADSKAILLLVLLAFLAPSSYGQLPAEDASRPPIPRVYNNLLWDAAGRLTYISPDGDSLFAQEAEPVFRLANVTNCISGTAAGLAFDFNAPDLQGTLYYGFIDHRQGQYKQPVFFKKPVAIRNGRAQVNVSRNLAGKYDMVGWNETGYFRMGYRVVRDDGLILYDGKIDVQGRGPFYVAASITEGPFLHQVSADSAVVFFKTNEPEICSITLWKEGAEPLPELKERKPVVRHQLSLHDLSADTKYYYAITYGSRTDTFHFRTAPEPGSRKPFTFAYCSDSRNGQGAGERNIYGVNAYIMKKMFALARQQQAAFVQFSGDLINGYLTNESEQRLQYANWKRAVEPFCWGMPFYAGFGNHEALVHAFRSEKYGYISIDKFPFATASAEAVFADEFCNPVNGPIAELLPEGMRPGLDVPRYDETAFHYRYDNVALISLNSDYLYSPSLPKHPPIGGNIHAYIMDEQLQWLQQVLRQYENDPTIDHIFVTQHTPAFPNGGHAKDDMWYNGNNTPRPHIAGEPVEQGIIERRDAYLNLLVNESSKVRAILTGDEHNYNRLPITEGMPRYPAGWDKPKLELRRRIYQINNGAAGAPYYAQEDLPWSDHVEVFSTENALILLHVNGKTITVEVLNPDTLGEVDSFTLVAE